LHDITKEPDLTRVNGNDVEKQENNEKALEWAWLAIDRLIWQAQRAFYGEQVGSAAINYIERRKADGHSNIKLFYADQKGKTMEKYSKRWKAIMAYLWRTH
jgi:predicted GNAT superfamily acetyltransferase